MQERIEARLAELTTEFNKGQARLRDLDAQRAVLGETLLRISGAIQVLQELTHSQQLPQRDPPINEDLAHPSHSDTETVRLITGTDADDIAELRGSQ